MKDERFNLVLLALLGGGLVFAAAAIFRFVEPEGSNLVQVSLVLGVLLGVAIGIILDRAMKNRM
ncbi:MAG: hypothetical protein GEEBNDBF_00505 [bacterium]|nr:hypothetical protein [bacterium]